jgi:flagellar biosynthesis protein FlhG
MLATTAEMLPALGTAVRPLGTRLRPVRVLAVTSGKGGVGKTTVAINLAVALAQRDRRVLLLDADLGLANIDVMLGLRPLQTLQHVLAGECDLKDILLQGPAGIRIVPAASGLRRMAELGAAEQAGLVHAFSELDEDIDWLIVDTPAGIAASGLGFCAAAQEHLVVVRNEPASIADAYAVIKVLHQEYGKHRFRVLVNMAGRPQEGLDLYQRLLDVTERFLKVSLDLVGTIPDDACVRKAIQRSRALLELHPGSTAGMAFKKMAERSDNWPVAENAGAGLEFFVERLVGRTPQDRRAWT